MKKIIFAFFLMLPISGSVYALPGLTLQGPDTLESGISLISNTLDSDPWVVSLKGAFANNFSISNGSVALFARTPRIGGVVDCYNDHNQSFIPMCEEGGGVASAVPEPFSALLFGAGLTVMALRKRRKIKLDGRIGVE